MVGGGCNVEVGDIIYRVGQKTHIFWEPIFFLITIIKRQK